ncbi:mCG1050902 [Mus musculus]|nr:mCG1050902 [Mus musculus]
MLVWVSLSRRREASHLHLCTQVDPRGWDVQNPFVSKHHSPVVIQLLDSTRILLPAERPGSSSGDYALSYVITCSWFQAPRMNWREWTFHPLL